METEREKIDREFNEAQSRKYALEKAERKKHTLAQLYMLPDGWEQKLAEAVVAAIKSGEGSGSCRLLKMSFPDQPYSVAIGFHLDLVALDYTEAMAETRRNTEAPPHG